MKINLFTRILSRINYYYICLLVAVFGISYLVKYLRNPHPYIIIKLLRRYKAKIGNGTTIKRSLIIDNVYEDQDSKGDLSNLTIGDNCYIGDIVYMDLANKIIIEDNSVISGKVSFITHADCNRSAFLNNRFPRTTAPIIIRKGSWIGFGVTLLNNVTIGENSVIGAGSLILTNIEPNTVNYGSPSKRIRYI